MKHIPLTQGQQAIVDDEDYDWLNQWKWHARKDCKTYYVVRKDKQVAVLMHRHIFGLTKGDGEETDHRNGNGLDNRRENLRICTHSQNHQNRHAVCGNSKYKGVCYHISNKKWLVHIKLNGQQIHIGYFDDEIEAAKAYDAKALEMFGEFACTNF